MIKILSSSFQKHKNYLQRLGLFAGTLGLVCSGLSGAAMAATTKPLAALAGKPHRSVCGAPGLNAVRCNAHLVLEKNNGKPLTTTTYSNGYAPAALHAAYKLPALPAAGSTFAWNGQTVAIVDAYDNPNAATDLLAYRRQFNLPLCATTSTNPSSNDLVGCLFSKLNQTGATAPLPASNVGWGQEIDLDIEMVSAACPSCKITLLEANSNAFADLGATVDKAAALGSNAISNSYGGSEFSSEAASSYDGHYNHPGIAITVSSGDAGYGVEFPAASQYVTAVGGTSLTQNSSSRGWAETAWSGAGSGCSTYIARPSWQPIIGSCSRRVVADVSAVADPNTGVAVYDSFGSSGANWYVFGGTSVAAPIVASVYALAGNAGGTSPTITYGEFPYHHTTNLFDVTSGSNGRCTFGFFNTTNKALCTAIGGFDGPTGLGTPNGTDGF